MLCLLVVFLDNYKLGASPSAIIIFAMFLSDASMEIIGAFEPMVETISYVLFARIFGEFQRDGCQEIIRWLGKFTFNMKMFLFIISFIWLCSVLVVGSGMRV